jgi:iron complex outermembrane recepter protein
MTGNVLKAGCVIVALALTTPALAQAPAADKNEGVTDIVVTAQRRAERAQDVPIAISAFSAAQMETQGITNTLQLGQYVPNLVAQVNTGVGSANAYFLRGLGNTESIATFDPPVGTYVDDIYLSRQNANNLSLFDVERVEVLRGPQGTLFGRNTTGGAISVIMRKPDFNALNGYGEIGYGSYNKKLARASVNVPLAPTFAAKISGYYQKDDGYVRNVTTGDRLNDEDGWGVRLGVRGELSAHVRWNASFAHIVNDTENVLNFDCNPANLTQCDGRFVTTGLREGARFATSPYLPTVVAGAKALFGLGNKSQTDLITSTIEFDVAPATTLSLITGYVSTNQQYALDFFDGRASANISNPRPTVLGYARGGFVFVNDGKNSQFTQEAKLNGEFLGGRIKYVAGIYYIDEINKTDFADLFSISAATQLLLGDRIVRNTTSSVAGFLQADVKVTDAVTLTAGIRYTDELKTISVNDNRAVCNTAAPAATCLFDNNLIASTGLVIPKRLTSRIWTPRFAINVKPADDILLFASATRGFKSGGWNARATAVSQFLPFAPEKVWSYEAGIKSEFFDHKLRTNLTAFYLDVKSLQTISGQINPVTGAFSSLTRNFADYRNKGIEGELTIVPATGLNLFVNFGYQDDKYIINRTGPATDIYGITSVAQQQINCLAQIAAGQLAASANTAPPGTPANNAPSCGNGIVTTSGGISSPVRTPDWTVSLGGSYRVPLGRMALVPSVNASYRSSQEVGIANVTLFTGSSTGVNGVQPANTQAGNIISGSRTGPAWLINSSLSLRGVGDTWSLSLECANCFDKSFAQSTVGNYTYLNVPRTWMLRAKAGF